MATAGNTRQQSTFQQEPESSENDYMTDDYEFSGDDEYDHENESEPEPKPEPQRMRQRQSQSQPQPQQQQRNQNNDYVDGDLASEDDYYSDDSYSDEYDDDDDEDENDNMQGKKAMQQYQPDRQSSQNIISGGSMETVPQNEKSINDEEGMKLRLDLNLDIEVELKAQIHGDITLALL